MHCACVFYDYVQPNTEIRFPPEQLQEAAVPEAAVVDHVEDEAPVLVHEPAERDAVPVCREDRPDGGGEGGAVRRQRVGPRRRRRHRSPILSSEEEEEGLLC